MNNRISYYPMFVNMSGKRCVVVGGGRVALRKVKTLLDYGADIEIVSPDLTCLGKIIGGGLPVGAYGGRREIMEMIAPLGPVYQAGTLSGNPLAMTAGIETLKVLQQPDTCNQLEEKATNLCKGITAAASRNGIIYNVSRIASLLTIFFCGNAVTDYESARQSDTELFGRFFRQLLSEGIYWPPSQFEAVFISLAHTDEDIDFTVRAIQSAFQSLA